MSYLSQIHLGTDPFNSADEFSLQMTDDHADIDHILVHLEMGVENLNALADEINIY